MTTAEEIKVWPERDEVARELGLSVAAVRRRVDKGLLCAEKDEKGFRPNRPRHGPTPREQR
jgi:hypothetical protein